MRSLEEIHTAQKYALEDPFLQWSRPFRICTWGKISESFQQRPQVITFYEELKAYKVSPDETKKAQLQDRFEGIFTQKTDYQMLSLALKRLYDNKAELMLVLERPEIPLHNNLSENDIREYVKRRKVSGSTRSEMGRRCRDTFTSLKKTCRKLGVSVWDYLLDRLSKGKEIPTLADLIVHHANSP